MSVKLNELQWIKWLLSLDDSKVSWLVLLSHWHQLHEVFLLKKVQLMELSVVCFLLNVDLVLVHQEVHFVQSNWDVNESEVGLGLSVLIQSRFWVNVHWHAAGLEEFSIVQFLFHMDFVLGHEEINLIKTDWNINESEVRLGLGVRIKGRFRVH